MKSINNRIVFLIIVITLISTSMVSCNLDMQEESDRNDISTSINKAYIYSNPDYYVTQENIKDVTISMDSDVPAMWEPALDEAISIWNSIPECAINIRRVQSGGDVNVAYKILNEDHHGTPDWALARGLHPSMGEVGSYININKRNETYFNSESFTELHATRTLAHEIGHTLGFQHNHPASDSEHIPGTDSDEPSIMSSNSISDSDILAAQILYPGPPEWPGSTPERAIMIEQYAWDQIVDLSHGYVWVKMELNQYPDGAGWQIHHTDNGQFNVMIEPEIGIYTEYSGSNWCYQAQENRQNNLVKISYISGSEKIMVQCW